MSDIRGYALSSFLLRGAWVAIQITVLAMIAGLFLGLLLALMRLSRFKLVGGVAWSYIWLERGTPLLLQLVYIFDALAWLGLRFDSMTTAIIGFALNEAAFSAEFISGGILTVNRNRSVAAASLGMGQGLTLRRTILPQAMRAILPQIANATIAMLKGTSLASIIFVNELTFRAQQIVSTNFAFFTVFIAAGLLYVVMTTVTSPAARYAASSSKPTLNSASGTQDDQPFVVSKNVHKSYKLRGGRSGKSSAAWTCRSGAARSSQSWGRADPASRLSCGWSIISNCSIRAKSPFQAPWSDIDARMAGLNLCGISRRHASAWCSSISTCSTILRRSRT